MGIPGGFGSVLVGVLISVMLYGIAFLQTYVYYMQYPEDASATKLLVAAIWILDTLHTSFMCHMLYYYLITNYGIPESLEHIVWSFQASVLVHVVLKPALGTCLTAPSLSPSSEVVGDRPNYAINTGSDWVWHRFVIHKTSVLTQISFYVLTPAFAIIVLTEVLITVSLCVLFYSSRFDSAFPSTKRLLNTLIIYAVNRCVLILLVAVGELAVAVEHQDAWIMALDFIVQGLYPNSLLASLNTRQYLQLQVSGTLSDLHTNTMRFANPPKLPGHEESSQDRARLSGIHEGSAIDINIDPAPDKTMVLRREGEA
ncbi:hypothetical protein M404DRAFT_281385 [Pisolithus tinctorius Marx 270]|uniref:DUF6534 domain-containing protein n=1 Tax=Pisolithus tinctorius Marx 270 TaxID=870435 RepID=A0A0C3P884_PISTI|nr:hypothetical protein M404DRAFT_281385 [Pisolithus tinctorius Marx 270]